MNTPHINTPKPRRSRERNSSDRKQQGFVPEFIPAAGELPGDESAAAKGRTPAPRRGVTVFHIDSPSAETVKLAADFTGWEKRPLDLVRAENGIWKITVQLPPGRYAYRFLVDGEWQDDPRCPRHEANPFGTANAVVDIA